MWACVKVRKGIAGLNIINTDISQYNKDFETQSEIFEKNQYIKMKTIDETIKEIKQTQ